MDGSKVVSRSVPCGTRETSMAAIEAQEARRRLRRALVEALGRRTGGTQQRSVVRNSAPLNRGDLRGAVAAVSGVPESELADAAVDETVQRIRAAAEEDAARVGEHLENFVDHLESIGCLSTEEITAYLDSADEVLARLYHAASRPHPSPTRLMQLALQYALDARRPVEGELTRFDLRRHDWGYEIVEYPSAAMRVPAIPRRGRPVRNVFAVRVLDCLRQDPPQIYKLMGLIEELLHGVPEEIPAEEASEASARIEFRVDLEASAITVRGTTYSVDLPQAYLVKALEEAGGRWVTGPEIRKRSELVGSRPDRVFKELPPAVQELIESKRAAGYRLCVEQLE